MSKTGTKFGKGSKSGLSGGGGGGGGGSAGSLTAQRLRLETMSTKMVYETLGFSAPLLPLNSDSSVDLPPPTKRGRHDHQEVVVGSEKQMPVKSAALINACLRKFYDKLPYNHGAQLCIEDLLSFVRKLGSSTGLDARVAALVKYLESPGFVEHLAAFGKLPNLPYILAFDPYAYQSKPPPTEEASKAFDPLAFAEQGKQNTMMPSKAELEALDKELEQIFNEKLPKSRMRCPKCKESKFMHFHEEQSRSADEGSSYIYFCANCGHQGRSR